VASCDRVDHFLADSGHVAARIARHYQREARVIYPPVDLDRFTPGAEVDDYYLVVSALAPYKRVDLAVEACSVAGRRLKVVGTGPELARLKSLAGPGVEFLGWVDDADLPALYARARALLFPGEEDFGITPLESMAAGRPVVALARGGALETVVGQDDPQGRPATGYFFAEQSVPALVQALDRLEQRLEDYDPAALAARAAEFSPQAFLAGIIKFIQEVIYDSPGVDRSGRP
jgi:glycosyltransferase involved in cell wall biosynthesis